MTRSRSGWLWLWLALLGAGAVTLAPAPAYADEDEGDDDDGWSSTHLNLRLGIWYRPEMIMNMQVNGLPTVNLPGGGGITPGITLPGTELNLQRDLGVDENAQSDYMFQNGILEAEVSFDTRFLSVGVWGIFPYFYEGESTTGFNFNFAGQAFSGNVFTRSRFEQWHAGLDIKINILDNEFIRISPIAAARVLAVDWEITQGLAVGGNTLSVRADTSDIDGLLKIDDDQVLPYVEVGGEIRVGYRHYIEADLKLTGLYVSYDGYRAQTLQFDAGVTGYLPIAIVDIGVRLGYRFGSYDFKSSEDPSEDDYFDFDLEFSGWNLSVVARF